MKLILGMLVCVVVVVSAAASVVVWFWVFFSLICEIRSQKDATRCKHKTLKCFDVSSHQEISNFKISYPNA